MRSLISTIISILLLTACLSTQQEKSFNKELKGHFSSGEISEFIKVLMLFENDLCNVNQTVRLNDNDSLNVLLFQPSMLYYLGEHRKHIVNVFVNTSHYLDLLSTNTKNKIWNVPNLKESSSGLDFNLKGEWIQFLKALSKDEQYLFLAEYVEVIENAGGQSPASSWFFYENQKKLNFNDKTLRLIVAINYVLAPSLR